MDFINNAKKTTLSSVGKSWMKTRLMLLVLPGFAPVHRSCPPSAPEVYEGPPLNDVAGVVGLMSAIFKVPVS